MRVRMMREVVVRVRRVVVLRVVIMGVRVMEKEWLC